MSFAIFALRIGIAPLSWFSRTHLRSCHGIHPVFLHPQVSRPAEISYTEQSRNDFGEERRVTGQRRIGLRSSASMYESITRRFGDLQ
jgi:hypothetical protein